MYKLPRLADVLYVAKDAPDVVARLNNEVQKLSGNIFYADQIALKLQEYQSLFETTDSDNKFIKKMRDKWLQDLNKHFVRCEIFYTSSLRRKSIYSLLTKMNSVMVAGRSINSIHDLMGIEFTVFTQTAYDTHKSIRNLYSTANIIFNYFADSKQSGEKFMFCDASSLKGVYTLETMLSSKRLEILRKFRELNPTCFIPINSGLFPEYQGFVKDYYRQPKIDSCYQGLQFVIKTEEGIYFEVQVKTQPVYDYKNDPSSKAYHPHYKIEQSSQNEEKANKNPNAPQFNLLFDASKVKNIYGFRADAERDLSGIISPVIWNLKKNTHSF